MGIFTEFVIDRIALDLLAVAAALWFPILEKFIQPGHLLLEAPFALLLPRHNLLGFAVRLGMFGDHPLELFL